MTGTTAIAQQPADPPAVDHSQHQPNEHVAPGAVLPIALPMTRQGSGTAWLPDASPMYAAHKVKGPWELMLHGNAFVQYLNEGGSRGGDQFGSINWLMVMARRSVAKGQFGVNTMISLEPWTIRGCGYPDLLATGERCGNRAIVDRQHPHDLFMELAAYYERPINDRVGVQVYGGPAGEPALGPVAYPHRISALPNPLAPISHHWLDATHISFGVVTAGVYGRQWKVEASAFNGREPDEHRRDVNLGALDSHAGRFWFLPSDRLALQVSAGHLREAEAPDEAADTAGGAAARVDVDRFTASATYHRLLGSAGVWASTIAWGRNAVAGQASDFVLAETNLTLSDRTTWFGRVEVGGKPAHDLDVHTADETFTLAKLQGGYARYFRAGASLRPGVGATVSMSVVPKGLEAAYGSRTPVGFGIFLTLRPAGMPMPGADPHAGHQMP